MDLDAFFAENPMGGTPDALPDDFKSGFVTLVGRPNAGKSTLLNAVMGKKIAITSDTAQTTRHRFRAVLTREGFQMIIVDTPGLHKPHDALGEELNTSAIKALEDVDVVAMLIDASAPIGRGDAWVAEQVRAARGAKKICVLSKCDLATEAQIAAQREAAEELADWDAMVALSSETGYNVEAFVEEVTYFLPEGPAWFPPDMETDQPLEVMIAEFIREKILRGFHDEVPHAIGVVVEDMEYVRKTDLTRIYAIVYVERDSQKGIIIGKRGSALKQIGTEARRDLEQLLGTRVFLDLRVKVKKNWRRDANQIRRFGYGEGL
ncbi:GTPase Era [Adlercreutzia sp. ZJ176]|uniref:GTPase Era n=1 Tax=unclassified Adlercreutzia TaxID=2636013 RepID=UPI00351A5CF4